MRCFLVDLVEGALYLGTSGVTFVYGKAMAIERVTGSLGYCALEIPMGLLGYILLAMIPIHLDDLPLSVVREERTFRASSTRMISLKNHLLILILVESTVLNSFNSQLRPEAPCFATATRLTDYISSCHREGSMGV